MTGLPKGIYFDGEVYFSTCPECGEEQGDMGNNVHCENCGYGPMPTMERQQSDSPDKDG